MTKETVLDYFHANPEARDSVMKAFHAYHAPHFRVFPTAHNFGGNLRCAHCHWCGRTREQVRWDDLPPGCGKRPPIPKIEDAIREEELKSFTICERAKADVPKLICKLGMSGKSLATLHHTHGYDPETVASIVDVPPQMLRDYHVAMETERARSRAAHVKEVVTVQTIL